MNLEGIGGPQLGEVRNPDGGRRKKLWKAAIERNVLKPIEGKVDLTKLDNLAEALILAAEAGDIVALKEIGDRIDGKVPQGIEHAGEIEITHHENDRLVLERFMTQYRRVESKVIDAVLIETPPAEE